MADTTPQKPVSVMALISYLGFLCLIPVLTKEQDEFVRFHMKQGLILFIGEVATWLACTISFLWALANIANLFWLVLSIIGIVNVVKGEKKEIPLVGQFANQLKI